MFLEVKHDPDTGMNKVIINSGISPATQTVILETPEQILMEVHDYAEVSLVKTWPHRTRTVVDRRGDVYLASVDSLHWETREDLTGAELPPRPGAPDYREHIDRHI